MADDDYRRLVGACHCAPLLKLPTKSDWGGARPGAGRKKAGELPKEKPPRVNDTKCPDCGVVRSRAAYQPAVVRCHSCSTKANERVAYDKGPLLPKVCRAQVCGAPFLATARSNRRYCSDKCRIDAGNAVQKARKEAEKAAEPPRQCPFCKVVFQPAYGAHKKIFCSVSCATKQRYKARPGSSHRRRARRFGVAFANINKWTVFARDGWTCQMCGTHTPRAKSGTYDNDAPVLDHILPISRGGPHTYENVQCLCKGCNSVKRNLTQAELAAVLA
jgi:5-methylcytosine-specific restriction endonuclease McrA